MKTTIFKSLLLLFISMASHFAFSQTTFRYSYDIGAFDISGGMVETPAGEFVFAGINNSFGPYYGDVVKTDATGTVVWAKTYTGGFATNFSDIKNVSTGGYIVTGSSTSGGGGAILVRIDALGAVIWAKRYQLPNIGVGNASNEFGSSVIETSDGGFLIGGGVDYFWDGASASTVDTTSAMAFKVNSAGTLIWNRTWTITNPTKVDEHYINDVAESADGYFFVGESADETQAYDSDGDLPRNALIIKTDKATGALTYIRRWGAGNTTSQGINSAKTLTTGNILLGGYDDLHGFLVSISGVGAGTPAVIFNRRLNGSIFGNTYLLQDIMENSDGNYSTIGTQLNILAFPIALNTMIVKLNSTTGALMFGRTYSPIGLSAILPEGGLCADQGYHIVMTDQQAGGFNANMIRTDPTGQLGAGPAGCASTNLSPALGTESVTFSTPVTAVYTSLTESTFVPVVNNVVPARVTHCLNVPCVAPTPSNAGTNQTVCGTTASLLGNTPTTGTGLWTLVSGAGTITTPSSPTSGVTGLGAGPTVFQWTISNAPCTASSSTVTITGVTTPTTSNAGSNQSICGTSASLTGNTPTSGTGTWTLVSGAGTITTPSSPSSGVTGLGVGPNVFQWSITNAPCPASTSTLTITGVSAPTTAAAGPNQTLCSTSAAFAGNPPSSGTGTWTLVSGAGTITTPGSPTSTVTGLGVGPNVFQWTISNAPCTPSSSTVTITNTGGPTTSAAGANQSVCGTTATLNGNTPTTGTGLWTLVSGAGTITSPTSPSSGVTGLGVGPNVFMWTISNPPCTPSTSTVTITGVTAPTTANAGTNQTICSSGATLAGNAPASGTGIWTLVSGTGTITTPSSPTSTVTGLGVGANVFMWTIDNAPCVASTSSVTITNTGGPAVAVTSQIDALCFGGASGTASANASSGSGPYDYVWTSSTGTIQTTLNSSIPDSVSGLTSGTYTITITDNSGCTTSSIVTISEPATAVSVSLTSSTPSGCASSTGTATVTASGGTVGSGYTYNWAPSGGTAATASSLGAGTYTVTTTDGNGCTSTTSVVIGTAGGPTASIASQTNVNCNGGSTGTATASGSGGTGSLTYSWSGGAGTAATASGLASGTYTVIVTDGAGCTSTSTATITQPTAVSGIVNTTTATCGLTDGTATASATGGTGSSYTYLWSPGSATTSTITGIAAGTYTVTITDSLGCTQTATGTVGTAGSPPVDAGTTTTIVSGGSTVLVGTAGAGATYSWTPPGSLSCDTCATPIASPTTTTTYTLTITLNGCTSTDTVTVFVEEECGELFVPNVFSPNGDGNNDVLQVYGNCILDFEFAIFDRWGQKVFEITDPALTWDGRFNGKMMDAAVFVYYLKGTVKGIDISKHGNITLVK